MKLADRSVHDLLAAFRSPEPTPGGGSAAALSGAVGASLLAMVAALPKPAVATAEALQRLDAAGTRCTQLASHLEGLIDRDSQAYERVVGAYRLPKASDEEKAARATQIQLAMRAAIDVPLEVMRACGDALDEGKVIARYGNASAASDVQVGLELLRAGQKGAQLNVEINLKNVTDQQYAGSVRDELRRLSALLAQ